MDCCFLSPPDFDAGEFSRQMEAVFGEAVSVSKPPENFVDYTVCPLFTDPRAPSGSEVSRDSYFLTFATKSPRSNSGLQIAGIRSKWDQLVAQNQDSEQALIEERRRKLTRAPMVAKSTAEILVNAKDLERPSPPIADTPAEPTASPAPPSSSGRKHQRHKKSLPPPKVKPPPPPRSSLASEAAAAPAAEPGRAPPRPPADVPPQVITSRKARPAQGPSAGLAARVAMLGNIPIAPGDARPAPAAARGDSEDTTAGGAQVVAPPPQIVKCARRKGAARPPSRAAPL